MKCRKKLNSQNWLFIYEARERGVKVHVCAFPWNLSLFSVLRVFSRKAETTSHPLTYYEKWLRCPFLSWEDPRRGPDTCDLLTKHWYPTTEVSVVGSPSSLDEAADFLKTLPSALP